MSSSREGFDGTNDYAEPVTVMQGTRGCRQCGRQTVLAVLANRAGLCIGCYEGYLRQPDTPPGQPTLLGRTIKAAVTGRLSLGLKVDGANVAVRPPAVLDDDVRLAALKRAAKAKADAYAAAHGIVL